MANKFNTSVLDGEVISRTEIFGVEIFLYIFLNGNSVVCNVCNREKVDMVFSTYTAVEPLSSSDVLSLDVVEKSDNEFLEINILSGSVMIANLSIKNQTDDPALVIDTYDSDYDIYKENGWLNKDDIVSFDEVA